MVQPSIGEHAEEQDSHETGEVPVSRDIDPLGERETTTQPLFIGGREIEDTVDTYIAIRADLKEIEARKQENIEEARLIAEERETRCHPIEERTRRMKHLNEIAEFLRLRLGKREEHSDKDVPIFKDPREAAKEFSKKKKLKSIADTFSTLTGLLAVRGTERQFILNIFNQDRNLTDDRLSQFGMELLKVAALLSKYPAVKESTWATFVRRLSCGTSFHAVALHGKQELRTEDIASGEGATKKSWGLATTPLILHCNQTEEDVDITLGVHHQVNGEPAVKDLAEKISEERPSDQSRLDKITDTTYRTIELLTSDELDIRSCEGGHPVVLQGIDYYRTNLEYASYTGEVSQNQISICVNGYELLLNIRDEDGEIKSREEIKEAISYAIEAGAAAVRLRNSTFRDTPIERANSVRYRIARRAGLSPQIIDVRGSSSTEETFAASRRFVNDLKRSRRFDPLTSALFRLSINMPEEQATDPEENYREQIQEARRTQRKLAEYGLSEVFSRRTSIKEEDLQALKLAEEAAPPEEVLTIDITDDLAELKANLRKRLGFSIGSQQDRISEAIPEEDQEEQRQQQEAFIKLVTGDAKILEAIMYAIGQHPVNCVHDELEKDLAISNTMTENNPMLRSFREHYANYAGRGRKTVDPKLAEALRIGLLRTVMSAHVSIRKAQSSESTNHHLIEATRTAGMVMAGTPRWPRTLMRRSFLILGSRMPQYYGGENFLKDLEQLNPRAAAPIVAADTEMVLTRMLRHITNLEDDVIGTTVSAPKVKRKYAGVGITAAYKRYGNIIMVNPTDGRKILTIRGHNARETRDSILQALKVLGEVTS